MKVLILILLALSLGACTTLKGKINYPGGITWDINYTTFGKKDLEDVSAKVGEFTFDLGSSHTDTPTGFSQEQLACIFFKVCSSGVQ